MRVKVLLFGPYALAVNAASIDIEIDDATPSGVLARCAREPRLSGLMFGARVAINGRFADMHEPIRERDEVAIIGLVSGG